MMTANAHYPGHDAVVDKGWWRAHRWLLLRRASQLSILGLFLLGPLAGIWIVKGNLTSSMTLDILPLTDPYILLQSVAAGHLPVTTVVVGAVIVFVVYALLGRMYCSWVCPVNIVTDTAAWLRTRIGLKGSSRLSRSTRYWLLAATLLIAALSGVMLWEWINPVSMLQRGLIFGLGLTWFVILAIFLSDLLVSPRGWCSHLCPMGAFYSLLGKFALLRVSARQRDACNDCGDCYDICPEPQIIKPALKGAKHKVGPLILAAECTNCARCIDICSKQVFTFSTRFNNQPMNPQLINHHLTETTQ